MHHEPQPCPLPALDVAAAITRGVRRMLSDRGVRSLTEVPLANGRRADVLGLAPDGTILVVEVKSSLPDFRSDRKWTGYLEFCDAFYFAVAADFPQEELPENCGLIVADAYGAEILREGPCAVRLSPARRKALMLRLALLGMQRLHRIEDPGREL